MSTKIEVRAGHVPRGAYAIERTGRLKRLWSPAIDLQGAQVQPLHQATEGTSMARNAVAGALLAGGVGLATGVLGTAKGKVMFQVSWPDGRTFIGECVLSAYQELLVAHMAANGPDRPSTIRPGVIALGALVLVVLLVIAILPR